MLWKQEVAEKLQTLLKKIGGGDSEVLKEIRETVLKLTTPSELVCSIQSVDTRE